MKKASRKNPPQMKNKLLYSGFFGIFRFFIYQGRCIVTGGESQDKYYRKIVSKISAKQGNKSDCNLDKGMDPAGNCGKRNSDQRLLCRISKAESFLFSDHVQVVPGVFPAHAPHLMLIRVIREQYLS